MIEAAIAAAIAALLLAQRAAYEAYRSEQDSAHGGLAHAESLLGGVYQLSLVALPAHRAAFRRLPHGLAPFQWLEHQLCSDAFSA